MEDVVVVDGRDLVLIAGIIAAGMAAGGDFEPNHSELRDTSFEAKVAEAVDIAQMIVREVSRRAGSDV